MNNRLGSWFGQGRTALLVVGWIVLVAVGAGLVWFGFTEPEEDRRPAITGPSDVLPLTPLTAGTVPPTAPLLISPSPTALLLPTDTPEPTPIPATATPVTPIVVAGDSGVNVRGGPGTNYTILGYLQPGGQAQVTGRYGDWWQIQHDGGTGWVFGGIVTAFNTENVPQVEPPPAPTPAPTPVPPTATPAPTDIPTPANVRGLMPNDYTVEGAPGPFAVNQDIWFNMDITNTSNETVAYTALGTWVEETGQFQQSWTYSSFTPGQHFTWRDHINIPAPGTYNLWMMVCFHDGTCARLKGPIVVTVQ
ncbi:MAG TPA: hypothetical protein ENI39_03610 [Anaerolineae bacterium]|nr:hypothetical protein [Anaerolineae bacterium]